MQMKLLLVAVAAIASGCAITPESAKLMSNGDLCFALYDQFSFTGRTEAAVRGEVAARGLDCSATGLAYARAMNSMTPPPVPQPAVVIQQPTYRPPPTVTCTSLPNGYGGIRTVCQ